MGGLGTASLSLSDAWSMGKCFFRMLAKDNLTTEERLALQKLRARTDIIIKPADKGSATVVMSKEAYIREAERQLENETYYHKLDTDPTSIHATEISSFIQTMAENELISKDTEKYLTTNNPRTARFYHLPKIHKPGNPGRPIISSCGAPTERISEYVDFHLQPLVRQIPSYLRDTKDFLQKITNLGRPPQECILLTLDVSSLYTNIPHEEGKQACKHALNRRLQNNPPPSCLIKMIDQILTLNNFKFNGQNFIQVQGTAMGTRMGPSYANIFMGELEENLLQQTSNRPAIWWRFIDDIFAIWTHGEDNLNTFLREINSFHETIKFTAEWSKEKVSFLDTTVFINESGIHTHLYTKPTDTHQYLMPTSCHPKHCTNSIPYSQSLRCRRICSNEEDFQIRVRELKQHLLTRGYNEELVDRQMERAIIIPRENTLQNHQRQTSMRIQRLPLVITYHPGLPKIANILKKHLPILHASGRLRDAVPNPPMVAFRRPKNLRDLLVRAELKNSGPPSTQTGNYQCQDKRCHTCKIIIEKNIFKSKIMVESTMCTLHSHVKPEILSI